LECDKLLSFLIRANNLLKHDFIHSTNKQYETNDLSVDDISALTVTQCHVDFRALISSPFDFEKELDISALFPHASPVINRYFKLNTPLLLVNTLEWETAVEVIEQVKPATTKVTSLLNYNQQDLFGRVEIDAEKQIQYRQGLLQQSDHAVFLLNISPLLVSPELWFQLKAFMQRGFLRINDAVNADKIRQVLPDLPTIMSPTKIILMASRSQLAELMQIDPEYTQVPSLFCELATQLPVTQQNCRLIAHYCQDFCCQSNIQLIDDNALITLLAFLVKACQHQQKILFSPQVIKELIVYANVLTKQSTLNRETLLAVINETELAQSLPRQHSEQGILEEQIKLQLSGEVVGQINGLSVVELLGYPCEFGEVFRISASDMIGDGELIDVERKVDLAGNIHAKSLLIVQGYINHLFNHVSTFPYSCHLVFEQSYQESDGDSASLATLSAALSCYAQHPIKQDVFVTGSLDQQGNVLAIGGINQKIEAVTRLFEIGLLAGPVTVVIPASNVINLTLNNQTLAFIEAGKIIVKPVQHCQQAFPILMGKTLPQLLTMINHRVEKTLKSEAEETSESLVTRALRYFSR